MTWRTQAAILTVLAGVEVMPGELAGDEEHQHPVDSLLKLHERLSEHCRGLEPSGAWCWLGR